MGKTFLSALTENVGQRGRQEMCLPTERSYQTVLHHFQGTVRCNASKRPSNGPGSSWAGWWLGLVANAVFVWTTDTRLERQLAEIRAAGDPLTLADLAPKPIPPEKNAATYLRRAEADVARLRTRSK